MPIVAFLLARNNQNENAALCGIAENYLRLSSAKRFARRRSVLRRT